MDNGRVYGVSVLDFGAKGDGHTRNFEAFQRALDSGAPRIVVPAGKYMLDDTLRVPSHTNLWLHPSAEMIMGDGVGKTIDNFLITNAPGAEDITIDGGIWNGNNAGNRRTNYRDRNGYHGVTVGFRHTKHLTLRNMTLRDSEGFHMRLNFVEHFLVENICFNDMLLRPNQDGVHIAGGCSDGVVRNIYGMGASAPNDDMVAIVASVPEYYNDLDMGDMRGQEHGPIRRIRVEHLRAENTFSFLRLLSYDQPVEDIEVSDVVGGCYYLAVQMQVEPLGRVQIGRSVLGTGSIRNVALRDFNVHRNLRINDGYFGAEAPPEPLVHIEQHVENFCMHRFCRNMERDAYPDSPTLVLDNVCENRIVWEGEDPASLSFYEPISGAVAQGLPARSALTPCAQRRCRIEGAWASALRIDGAGFDDLSIN